MKNMPDIFSLDFMCFQTSPFETVILCTCITVMGTFFQIKSANMHRWNSGKHVHFNSDHRKFLTRVISLHLCSINFNLFGRNSVSLFKTPQTSEINNIPLAGLLQKHVSLGDWSSKHQNSFVCLHKTCLANSQNYWVLKTILEMKVAIIGVSSGQTVLLQEMSRRVYSTSCQFEINAFPSFVGLKLWRSKITQKLKLGEQVLWKRLIELMTFQWPVNVGNFRLNSWKHKLTSIV